MSTKKQEHHHASHTETRVASIAPSASVVQAVSDDERSRSIQIRAYGLWEQAGRPGGIVAQEGFWFEAEKELTAARASS